MILHLSLVNPFKDTLHIILPPLNLVYKVTLSVCWPYKESKWLHDCSNLWWYTIHDYDDAYGNIAFIRRGQLFWTYIDTSNSSFIDVIFYKGLLFALNLFNQIVSFNFDCSNDHLYKKTITSNVVWEITSFIFSSCTTTNGRNYIWELQVQFIYIWLRIFLWIRRAYRQPKSFGKNLKYYIKQTNGIVSQLLSKE
jgi:hypothetical protein